MNDNFVSEANSSTELPAIPAPSPDVPPETKETPAGRNEADERLRVEALSEASGWELLAKVERCLILEAKWREADSSIQTAFSDLPGDLPLDNRWYDQVQWVIENMRPLRAALRETRHPRKISRKVPQIRIEEAGRTHAVPRAYAAAGSFLRATAFIFDERSLTSHFAGLQEHDTFELGEIWALRGMLQLVLLEEIGRAVRALLRAVSDANNGPSAHDQELAVRLPQLITCLRKISDAEWKDVVEHLSSMERILRDDPSGTYTRMDYESRNLYRGVIQKLARQSDADELEVAQKALDLALGARREWSSDTRVWERRNHVGYYLVDSGRKILESQINYRPGLFQQVAQVISDWPEVFYLVGIELLTLAAMAFVLSGLDVAVPLIPAMLLLLLPATEAGMGVMNRLVSFLLPPRVLPKLDLSQGIPADCTTMVAVPTLLINEQQVRQIVRDLEIRYLANPSANLHFALLTDPPDSPQPFDEKEHLVALCSKQIEELNEKYADEGKGCFFLFHRHRVYNPSEGAWMGWERKRGKLLDFNNLLRQKYDSFPIKVGDLRVLPAVRYVITLDADTELPRESAHRLIGTLAHPLNRAVIDPATNTVVEGYGVLQPRVGISVKAASRSRLASIYSGQTGFDIYTRAVSNVYQDLFAEGSFTGKGIYEVDAFQQVLAERFPYNAILSHDLIEGAYARAGLVSDIELIDDYPSHFSAYSRRKHRWVRGDWQIMRWLFPRVPDARGTKVQNPLGVIARWKILDNLRRSLVETATFVLLLAGWFFLPGGPVHWTVATLVLMLIPSYIQVALAFSQVGQVENLRGFLKDTWDGFVAEQVGAFLLLAFLAHQTLVTLDAIVRTVVRLTVTHRRLLEWETAAQAELEMARKATVDVYLDWMPWLSLVIGLDLLVFRRSALPVALPVLILWACSKYLSRWLNRPLRPERTAITGEDEAFLRATALSTWRFFRTLSNAENNWLIPDNLQETPPSLAQRISPTNLGLLLTSRVAAYDLGFLTLAEFVNETERTLAAAKQITRYNGHFLNWYDTRDFTPIEPLFVSTVDSGNLVCCLWILKQACLQIRTEAFLNSAMWLGICDHLGCVMRSAEAKIMPGDVSLMLQELSAQTEEFKRKAEIRIQALPRLEQTLARLEQLLSKDADPAIEEMRWWILEVRSRLAGLNETVQKLVPWLLPENRELFQHPALSIAGSGPQVLALESLPAFIADLDARLEKVSQDSGSDTEFRSQARQFRSLLMACTGEAESLSARLKVLAQDADTLVRQTDFGFLYDPHRKVLSIGYDVSKRRLEESCYEVLASEARSAAFAAIAKEDVPQESWFHLGRAHTLCEGERVLLSWSGTMFEYLMPVLWMRAYPNTIVEQSLRAAVRCQQKAAKRRGVPWGISEAACSRQNATGHYEYHAFGLRRLALKPHMPHGLVVSPYSTFLALAVDAAAAMNNLRAMNAMGWCGRFGFYESAEFALAGGNGTRQSQLARCWMAHHQGMILLSISNLLADSAIQRRFHDEPMVAATERLLHERVPGTVAVDYVEQADSDEATAPASSPAFQESVPAS